MVLGAPDVDGIKKTEILFTFVCQTHLGFGCNFILFYWFIDLRIELYYSITLCMTANTTFINRKTSTAWASSHPRFGKSNGLAPSTSIAFRC